MTAKDFLCRHYEANIQINAKLAELKDLKEKATAIGSFDYSKDRVVSSRPTAARYEDIAVTIADKETKLKEEIQGLIFEQAAVEECIDEVEDAEERTILSYRYLSYMTFEQIAEAMDCSVGKVYYTFRDAIEKLNTKIVIFDIL